MNSRWPFIGRVAERARIDGLLAAGTGAIVLGEAGIGKTALVRHVEEAQPGATVGRVLGHAVSTGAAYAAFATVLSATDKRRARSGRGRAPRCGVAAAS